jgi:hypothetical protein
MTTRKKACFGILDNVFPVGEEGLREVVPACFQCTDRVECLRTALATKEGLEMRAQKLEQTAACSGLGWLRRWSRKKELSRLVKQTREKKK